MKEINVHLQQHVLSKLKLHWQRDAHADFTTLQDVSDSAQDRCLLALMQLQQRVVTTGSVNNITPPPLNITSTLNDRPLPAMPPPMTSPEEKDWGFEFTKPRPLTPPRSPPDTKPPPEYEWSAQSTFASPTSKQVKQASPPTTSAGPKSVPLVSAATQQTWAQQNAAQPTYSPSGSPTHNSSSPPSGVSHHRDGSKGSSDGNNPSIRIDGCPSQYKPLATTTEKVGFFGIRKKKVEMIPDVPENPLVDKYLNEAIEDETKSLRRPSMCTARSGSSQGSAASLYSRNDPDDETASILTAGSSNDYPKAMERAESYQPKRPLLKTRKSSQAQAQQEVLSSSRPLAAINPQDLLPNELNNYAGFCKGAWRQQIGDHKRAMEDRVRPGSMYNTTKFWQCRQCKFEGRYVPPTNTKNKKDKAYDMRVARLTEGIQFRWEFLFKSHIAATAPVPDPAKATYGCIFCCAEGRGSPMFDGVVNFVKHLVEHRDPLPTGEVLYRMNTL